VRRVIRAALALCILLWLAHSVGFGLIEDQLRHADVPLLLAATLLLAIDGLAKARNWQQLLIASVGYTELKFHQVLTWHFAGGFVGAIVPSSAGTDACRVFMALRGLGGHAAPCAATILTVNGLGWFTGSAIGVIGAAILLVDDKMPTLMHIPVLMFVATLAVLPIAYGLLAARREWLLKWIDRVGQRSVRAKEGLTKFLDALLVFEQAHVRFPVYLAVSTLGLLAQTGMFALTADAVGIHLPFAVWMVLVPLTRLVALIPVSIADFGLIQAAHVSVLGLFGVPAVQAFALSALFAVEGLIIHSTLGSAAFLYSGRREGRAAALPGQQFSLDATKSVR
jgi:glycosyltransferase 2 family protein